MGLVYYFHFPLSFWERTRGYYKGALFCFSAHANYKPESTSGALVRAENKAISHRKDSLWVQQTEFGAFLMFVLGKVANK